MIFVIIGLIVGAVIGLFFLFRWFFSPFRIELRRSRRACRRDGPLSLACARYEKLKQQGHL